MKLKFASIICMFILLAQKRYTYLSLAPAEYRMAYFAK